MSSKIHVYNDSERKILVQCYAPNSTDKWGGLFSINPGLSSVVYTAGFFEGDTDLFIEQCEELEKPDGQKTSVMLKKTRFKSGKDISWIVKESFVVQQEYGKELNKEDPHGEKHEWEVKADKIFITNVEYLDIPTKPDEWKINMITEGLIRNLNTQKAMLSGKIVLNYSESKNWSHKTGLKVELKTCVKAGIPILAEGKIEVGVEGTYEYTWGGSFTESKSWEQSVSVPVDPHKMVEISGKAMQGILTIPYNATFILEYNDVNEKFSTQIRGKYVGVCAKKTELQVSQEKSLDIDFDENIRTSHKQLRSSYVHDADIISTVTMSPGSKMDLQYDDASKKIISAMKN